MSLHPWIDPDDAAQGGLSDVRDIGMAVIDDDGLLVPLDSDNQDDRELYAMVIRDHPAWCRAACPGLS